MEKHEREAFVRRRFLEEYALDYKDEGSGWFQSDTFDIFSNSL